MMKKVPASVAFFPYPVRESHHHNFALLKSRILQQYPYLNTGFFCSITLEEIIFP
jgi:hypothetical protein